MPNTPTTNLGFLKPTKGDRNWDDEINGNWDKADATFGDITTIGNYDETTRPSLTDMLGDAALSTTDKTIIGAINELSGGGASAMKVEDLSSQVGDATPGVFVTSVAYVAGSLLVFKNGVAQIPGGAGNISESDPANGFFTFTAGVPVSPETVMVAYTPA